MSTARVSSSPVWLLLQLTEFFGTISYFMHYFFLKKKENNCLFINEFFFSRNLHIVCLTIFWWVFCIWHFILEYQYFGIISFALFIQILQLYKTMMLVLNQWYSKEKSVCKQWNIVYLMVVPKALILHLNIFYSYESYIHRFFAQSQMIFHVA